MCSAIYIEFLLVSILFQLTESKVSVGDTPMEEPKEEKRMKKKKGPKGPNPLSVKKSKKKKRENGEDSLAAADGGVSKSKVRAKCD